MEVKVVSVAGRSANRISKERYHKTQNSVLSKKRVHHTITESMRDISKVMSHLIPKGRHIADDVNLLEFTIEYLRQTADFHRGVGLCAEETKKFLKRHVFDRNKIRALFQKIEQRIEHISKPEYLGGNNIDAVGELFQRQHAVNASQVEESAAGVLLDLSMKQNRLRDETDYSNNSTNIHSFRNNLKKREILDQIRKKILHKRRTNDTSQKVELIQNEIMWRPWRY